MTRSACVVLLTLLISTAPFARAANVPAAHVTIPAGSEAELTNIRIVWMKGTQAGETLYMQVNESLVVDRIPVIPAGTYVQATLLAATLPVKKKDDEATLHLRFDKLIFPNGYTVVLGQAAPLVRVTVLVTANSDILLDNGQWLHIQFPASLDLDLDQVMEASTLSTAPGLYKPGTLCRGALASVAPKNGAKGAMPPIILPGTSGTPDNTQNLGPNNVGTTVQGAPAQPDMIIPSQPNFDDDDKPVICAVPPSIDSIDPETNQSALQASAVPPSLPTLTIPADSVIALTLSQPVTRKLSRNGNAVSATVAFPATVGSQLAIPAGTKVEGTITKFKANDSNTHQPEASIQFTRLVYPNGYTVTLDTPGEARLVPPSVVFPLTGVTLFDAGWQFQMTTRSALTVDAVKASAR